MFVRDRMSTPPVTLTPDTVYHDALQIINDRNLRHLPVIDAEERLIGVVTERDLLRAALQHVQAQIEVEEIMSREVITATPETPIEEAAQVMATNRIGGLPVVDGERRVLGMITETDIFGLFVELVRERKVNLD